MIESFQPKDLVNRPPTFTLPNAKWASILECPCTFSPEIFSNVMLNLIMNPNIHSSHLFRADIFYDSLNDVSFTADPQAESLSDFCKHMKKEYQPVQLALPGSHLERTIVRQLVPRNPQLDRHLVQTCHFFSVADARGQVQRLLVLQIPHVSTAHEMPWYHPAVRSVAFTYNRTRGPPEKGDEPHGLIAVHYCLFPDTGIDTRLSRTALHLLQTVHKHGHGLQAGYQKRVHHDLIIPQARFQNTYAALKARYAKELIGEWSEQTDPTKHVFEDLGIAAFLVELWRDMYGCCPKTQAAAESGSAAEVNARFPGFIDIGCGNGVLVYVLLQEGYEGWGFDARRRETWDTFPESVRQSLKEMVLVPSIFSKGIQPDNAHTDPARLGAQQDQMKQLNHATNGLRLANGLCSENMHDKISPSAQNPVFHDGSFPAGTFIISNHADELTAWTPLLAYLSSSPFVAIPCCSHNLAGARFRAPANSAGSGRRRASQNDHSQACEDVRGENQMKQASPERNTDKTGSLARPKGPKQPSAYASLCAYVERLAAEVDFTTEREMLRIPSTRNAAIVGRVPALPGGQAATPVADAEKEMRVREIVEREVGRSADMVGREWVDSGLRLVKGKAGSH